MEKFKVGDKVMLLTNNHGYFKNDIGVIISVLNCKEQQLCEIFVPNRESISTYRPNVIYTENTIRPLTRLEKLNRILC